jgi:hypothetical protein
MKNRVHYSFLLCLVLVGSLLILSWVPNFTINEIEFKKIDFLSAIRPDEKKIETIAELTDTAKQITAGIEDSIIVKQDSIVQEIQETCPPGLTCIEDYSHDSTALKHFVEALNVTEKSGKPVRIAFYGDSFIEGDVVCGSFRDSLQSIFGGEGVGFVPITSNVAGFRNTIKHNFKNWRTVSLIGKKDTTAKIGPAGYSFIPLENNWVEYKPSKQRYLRSFNTIKLYFTAEADAILNYKIDTVEESEPITKSKALQEWKYNGDNIKSTRFEFYPFDSLQLYGASFENGKGVYVDNFSLRGNSGMSLSVIPPTMFKQFNSFRDYKLIILQFGLNLVIEDSLNYKAYTKRMVKVVNQLKTYFPKSSFLLLSVSDRSSNSSGEFKTMNAIPAMRNAQRLIAQQTGIAFWDLYQAMGGENSMVKLVESSPALAAKDYTHLNFRGGKRIAGAMVKSLLHEKQKWRDK